jgi:hypothetical protein
MIGVIGYMLQAVRCELSLRLGAHAPWTRKPYYRVL